MIFTSSTGGSSTYRTRHIVALGKYNVARNHMPQIHQVSISNPVDTLAHLIGLNQHSDDGRTRLEVDPLGVLRFAFSIWNDGDRSNFPSGGWVEGTMKLIFDDERKPLRFEVDKWEYHAAEESNREGYRFVNWLIAHWGDNKKHIFDAVTSSLESLDHPCA